MYLSRRLCRLLFYINRLSMTFTELRWASFRIFSYSIVAINILTFGFFLYVIGPYTSYFFFGDLRFWKYLSYFHKYYFFSIVYLKAIVLNDEARSVFQLPLTAPPMDFADPRKFRLAKEWKHPVDSCNECSKCCYFLAECCFFDRSQNRCLSYRTLFWRFFNCGRFPLSKKQLDYFNCTKFECIKSAGCVDETTPQGTE